MLQNKLEHIAFILDGNKRWAKKNNSSTLNAYKKGFKNISDLVDNCLNLKIKYLTLFTLSSENIKRKNVSNIFQVIYDDFALFFNKIIDEKNVKIKIIGSRENLPKKIINLINHSEKSTFQNNKLILNLAFNYGFKYEIKEVLKNVSNNKIDLEKDDNIKKLFLIGSIPDPDILIRTGGERRLSNFIMYNLTYTELYFIDKLWPDFKNSDLLEIVNNYENISRRYGL